MIAAVAGIAVAGVFVLVALGWASIGWDRDRAAEARRAGYSIEDVPGHGRVRVISRYGRPVARTTMGCLDTECELGQWFGRQNRPTTPKPTRPNPSGETWWP